MLFLPLYHHQIRKSFPAYAKSQGHSVEKINEMMSELTPELMDKATKEAKGANKALKAIGDGGLLKTIITKLKDFFSSPEGKAVLELLLKMLLGILIAKNPPPVEAAEGGAVEEPTEGEGDEESVIEDE